jgi:hypothetical protein
MRYPSASPCRDLGQLTGALRRSLLLVAALAAAAMLAVGARHWAPATPRTARPDARQRSTWRYTTRRPTDQTARLGKEGLVKPGKVPVNARSRRGERV